MVCCKCHQVIAPGAQRVCPVCGNAYCPECARKNYDLCDCFSELNFQN